jgi:hypothetical protein
MARFFAIEAICCLGMILVAPHARAEPRLISLQYIREKGAENCPDERWIRQAVSARLGFDPFRADASTRIDARMSPAPKGMNGSLVVVDAAGKRLGRRELVSEHGDCLELASALELAITIAVDPQYLVAKPRAPLQPPPPAPELLPASEPPPAPSRPWVQELEGGPSAFATAGLAPNATAGVAIGTRIRWTRWSLGVEGRVDFLSGTPFGLGRVDSMVMVGSVLPCVHVSPLGLCGIFSAGALQVTGDFSSVPFRQSSPIVLAGGRAELQLRLAPRAALKPFVEVQAAVTRTTVYSGQDVVWVTSPLTGAGGFALWFSFL